MASLMRALIIDGTKSASVQRVPVPVPGPRQAVVDVHRVGICGTDVELFTRELPYFEQGKSRSRLPRPRVVRHRVRRRDGGRRGLGRRAGHRRHHARLRPLPPVRVRASSRVRRPERDRHHRLAGCPRREARRSRREPATGFPSGRRPAGGPRGAGRQRAARRAGGQAGPGTRLLVWGPGSIGLLAAAFARAAGADVDVVGLDSPARNWRRASARPATGRQARPAVGNLRRRYRLQRRRRGPRACPAVRRAAGRLVYIGLSGSPASSTAATSCSTTSRRWESSARRPAWRPQSSTTPTAGCAPGRSPRSSSASTARRRPSPARLIPAREPRSTSTRAASGSRTRHRLNRRRQFRPLAESRPLPGARRLPGLRAARRRMSGAA